MDDYIVDGHTTKVAGTAAQQSSDPSLGQQPVIAEHDNTTRWITTAYRFYLSPSDRADITA